MRRCVESGVMYLNSKVETIIEATDGHNLVACGHNRVVPCRLVTVASGAASGKLLQYAVGVQESLFKQRMASRLTLMIFMDYRDYTKQEIPPWKHNIQHFFMPCPCLQQEFSLRKLVWLQKMPCLLIY